MPRFNPYSQGRPDKQAQATALDQSQQQLDQSQQHDWINQIASLYGIQQQQQMLPGQLQGQQLQNTYAGLENTNLGLQNDYLPSNEQAKQTGIYAMAGANDTKAGPLPHDIMQGVQYGIYTPEQARQMLMTPEQKAADVQAQAGKTQTHWQNLEGDARANGVAGREGTIMNEFGPDNLEYLRGLQGPPPATAFSGREGGVVSNPYTAQSALGLMGHDQGAQDILGQLDQVQHVRRAKMSPDALYNEQHPLDAVWNYIFGRPISSNQPVATR